MRLGRGSVRDTKSRIYKGMGMEYSFVIKGEFFGNNTFPGLNDYLAEMGRHPIKGNKMKQDFMTIASSAIRTQIPRVEIDKPVYIKYAYFEPTTKRDPSNISAFAIKVIEDALQRCDVLKNDGWKNIAGYSQEFHIDKENPRIEVTITEKENLS